MQNIRHRAGLWSTKALTRVRVIETMNIIEANSLVLLVIDFNWFLGPDKKQVPINDTILPRLNDTANLVGLPARMPMKDPKDINWIIEPTK